MPLSDVDFEVVMIMWTTLSQDSINFFKGTFERGKL
jgi:hypothetical protein